MAVRLFNEYSTGKPGYMLDDTFKFKYKFEDRVKEANNIRSKYPERVPVIVERQPNANVPIIDKNKYLVPNDLTVGQFMYVIRKRMKLPPEQALFIFVQREFPNRSSIMPNQACLMSTIYDESRDKDGFLYVNYTGENTFGCLK